MNIEVYNYKCISRYKYNYILEYIHLKSTYESI